VADEEFVQALDLEVARQQSQTVEDAAVITPEKVALSPNAALAQDLGGVKQSVSAETVKQQTALVLMWVSGIMIFLVLSGVVVYGVHRRTSKVRNK